MKSKNLFFLLLFCFTSIFAFSQQKTILFSAYGGAELFVNTVTEKIDPGLNYSGNPLIDSDAQINLELSYRPKDFLTLGASFRYAPVYQRPEVFLQAGLGANGEVLELNTYLSAGLGSGFQSSGPKPILGAGIDLGIKFLPNFALHLRPDVMLQSERGDLYYTEPPSTQVFSETRRWTTLFLGIHGGISYRIIRE